MDDFREDDNVLTDNVRERRFLVDQNFVGWRLDQFLANRIPRISRTFAGEIVRHGDLRVIPERRVKPSMRLRMDDVVVLREALEPETVQDAEAAVLYRDEAIVVVDKPAGMLVHESSSVRLNTVTHFLLRQGLEEAEPVHRIDRETSGVVVCAAKRKFVAPLRGMFATTHPDKIYRALVLDPDEVWQPGARRTITTPLGPHPDSILSVRMAEGHLDAVTHVTALGRVDHPWGPMADLEVAIETGRQHQIRVHLAMQGTPIAGDKLYGQSDEFFMAICATPDDPELRAKLPFERHALHAWKIRFVHPISGQHLEIEAPVPGIWNAVAWSLERR